MADLTITETAVKRTSSTLETPGVAGEAIDIGQWCYQKSSDLKYYKCVKNGTEEQARVAGMSGSKAVAADQPITIFTGGSVEMGNIITTGEIYALSNNAGKIAPIADTVATNRVSVGGFGDSPSAIRIDIMVTGRVKA